MERVGRQFRRGAPPAVQRLQIQHLEAPRPSGIVDDGRDDQSLHGAVPVDVQRHWWGRPHPVSDGVGIAARLPLLLLGVSPSLDGSVVVFVIKRIVVVHHVVVVVVVVVIRIVVGVDFVLDGDGGRRLVVERKDGGNRQRFGTGGVGPRDLPQDDRQEGRRGVPRPELHAGRWKRYVLKK